MGRMKVLLGILSCGRNPFLRADVNGTYTVA